MKITMITIFKKESPSVEIVHVGLGAKHVRLALRCPATEQPVLDGL